VDSKREVAMKLITLLGLVVAAAACGEGAAQRADNGTASAMAAALESGVQPQGIVARRLASNEDVYRPRLSTFSPDGKYQAFNYHSHAHLARTYPSSGTPPGRSWGELAIRNLETGEIRQVTNREAESEWGAAMGGMVFSSDGTQIAYGWFQHDGHLLRTIAVEGGEARTLFDAETRGADWVEPLDWSPDDKAVLVGVIKSDRGRGFGNDSHELATVSTSDGGVRTLKDDVGFRVPYGRAFFSPDGLYVAYSALFAGSDAMSDVRVLALESGREEQILSGPSDELVLGWSEDGRRLYVMSDRAGSPSLWAVPMAEGARAGDPKLIRREVHGFISGHVVGGKLLFHIVTESPQLYTMELDLETGRVLSEPVAEEGGRTMWIDHPVWSPDGQFLAYARGRDPQSIVVRAAMGDHLRQFALPAGFVSVSRMRWTPDSRSLLIGARGSAQGASNVLVLTLTTGDFEVGLANPRVSSPLSADGRTVYSSGGGRVRVFDLTTGEVTDLYRGDGDLSSCFAAWSSLSPSDDRLAFSGPCVGVMPTAGGEPTWLYRGSPMLEFSSEGDLVGGELFGRVIAWTADASSLLFAKSVPGEYSLKELWIVRAAGGSPRKLFAFDGLWSVAAHPDNRRIAFMAGEERYEMWVMEGLDEAAKE
jgi:Tol biopolymer transport system component